MNAFAQQAIAAFRSMRTTPFPNRRFEKLSSRDADKFVIRLPNGMRSEVEVAADDQFTSMNSFILQAIAEKLDREGRQDLLLDALAEAVVDAKWCATMNRPTWKCGCPDCGSSLVQIEDRE
ncbi:Arc family DNA-binding protein [Pseudomonas alliivorans]|nr:Arc family DNA-binding protein [Pseudomonas alliivorans]